MSYTKFAPLGALTAVTLISGAVLASSNSSALEASKTANAVVTVSSACTMVGSGMNSHVLSTLPGYYTDIGSTTLKTICNDNDGYAIYAVGFSNNTLSNTDLIGANTGATIPTGTATGKVSNWSMKISKDTTSYSPENLTIENGYDNYNDVPSEYTMVASFAGATDTTQGSAVKATYAVRLAHTQAADTYTGKVKYVMVHPSNADPSVIPPEPDPEAKLYLQNVTLSACPSERTLAYDKRDEKGYYIQKIGSDCWMTTNLDLDGGTELTSELSNLAENTTYTLPASSESGFNNNATAYVYNSGSNFCAEDAPCYSYYSYVAATAGSTVSAGEDATYDICPKGWKLPTNAQYSALADTYSTGSDITVSPWYGVYNGYYYRNAFNDGDFAGNYWSATARTGAQAYSLYFEDTEAYTNSAAKSNGYAVRCVSDPNYVPALTVTYMQDVTIGTCSTTPQEVVDRRDGTTYTIQKLADGKCWLLDNLALDLTNADVKNGLSSSNTNASRETLNYFVNGGGTASDKYANAGVTAWTGGSSYGTPLVNSTSRSVPSTGGYAGAKYGVYYNFCAASAGSFCYGDNTNAGSPVGNASEDICPKGWRMPTGGAYGEYQALADLTATTADYINDLRIPLSGYYYGGSVYNQEQNFYLWSSTRQADERMYSVNLFESALLTQNHSVRTVGASVRCILK